MAFTIRNQAVENLLDSIVKMTGETKTEAVRKVLEERQQRLALRFIADQDDNLLNAFLVEEIWPQIPPDLPGTRLSKEDEEAIFGLGELGV